MSCCGKQREQIFASEIPAQEISRPQPASPHAIRFEYVGATGMTVLGPITGRRYRFDRYGSQVLVDPRDAPSLASVPHLRRR